MESSLGQAPDDPGRNNQTPLVDRVWRGRSATGTDSARPQLGFFVRAAQNLRRITKKAPNMRAFLAGGGGGIRTHGDPKATTVFETAPIVHSGTSPLGGRIIS